MINCNPETVSTDYDTSDRLYFEPLTDEDVANVLEAELAAGGARGRGRSCRSAARRRSSSPARSRPSSCSAPARPPSTWPRTASAGTRCARGSAIPQPPGRHGLDVAEALGRGRSGRLSGAGAPELRPRRPGHGDRLRRRRACAGSCSRMTTGALAREGRRHGRATGAGRPLLGGRDRGRRRRGARRRPARSSSPASWSTSRRPGCTRATRPAPCRRRPCPRT